jgi:hypothetical protein
MEKKKTARGDGVDLLWGNRAVQKRRKNPEALPSFFQNS